MKGCGNYGCIIEPPIGQGTNGRCKCLDKLVKEVQETLSYETVTPKYIIMVAIKHTIRRLHEERRAM